MAETHMFEIILAVAKFNFFSCRSITVRVQRLLMLLPTDPDVQEALDSIGKQVMNSLQTRFNLKAIITVANST